jgi:hypothetical protein
MVGSNTIFSNMVSAAGYELCKVAAPCLKRENFYSRKCRKKYLGKIFILDPSAPSPFLVGGRGWEEREGAGWVGAGRGRGGTPNWPPTHALHTVSTVGSGLGGVRGWEGAGCPYSDGIWPLFGSRLLKNKSINIYYCTLNIHDYPPPHLLYRHTGDPLANTADHCFIGRVLSTKYFEKNCKERQPVVFVVE